MARRGMTQAQIKSEIARRLKIPKSSVDAVLGTQHDVIGDELRRSGSATVPGIVKLTVKRKKATKARRGTSPFDGTPMTFKAKPARDVVRARPLAAIKDSI